MAQDSGILSIRRADLNDADALALVGGATFLESFAGVLDGADIVAHCQRHHSPDVYRRALEDIRCRAWVAETTTGAAIVGYVLVTPPDLPLPDLDAGDFEVKRIYLLRRFQGGGIGRRLMDVAMEDVRARGARRLLLGVYSGNDQALGFYRRLGFERVGDRLFRVGAVDHYDYILARPVN